MSVTVVMGTRKWLKSHFLYCNAYLGTPKWPQKLDQPGWASLQVLDGVPMRIETSSEFE